MNQEDQANFGYYFLGKIFVVAYCGIGIDSSIYSSYDEFIFSLKNIIGEFGIDKREHTQVMYFDVLGDDKQISKPVILTNLIKTKNDDGGFDEFKFHTVLMPLRFDLTEQDEDDYREQMDYDLEHLVINEKFTETKSDYKSKSYVLFTDFTELNKLNFKYPKREIPKNLTLDGIDFIDGCKLYY